MILKTNSVIEMIERESFNLRVAFHRPPDVERAVDAFDNPDFVEAWDFLRTMEISEGEEGVFTLSLQSTADSHPGDVYKKNFPLLSVVIYGVIPKIKHYIIELLSVWGAEKPTLLLDVYMEGQIVGARKFDGGELEKVINLSKSSLHDYTFFGIEKGREKDIRECSNHQEAVSDFVSNYRDFYLYTERLYRYSPTYSVREENKIAINLKLNKMKPVDYNLIRQHIKDAGYNEKDIGRYVTDQVLDTFIEKEIRSLSCLLKDAPDGIFFEGMVGHSGGYALFELLEFPYKHNRECGVYDDWTLDDFERQGIDFWKSHDPIEFFMEFNEWVSSLHKKVLDGRFTTPEIIAKRFTLELVGDGVLTKNTKEVEGKGLASLWRK